MLDVMYEAPNQKTLKKVIIDKDVVLKQKPPIYVYEKAS
jgi:ATP-dependent Clp protease ATP-binding subunit ClpX